MRTRLRAIAELKALPAGEQEAILSEFKQSTEMLVLQKRINLFSRWFLVGLVSAVIALMVLLTPSGLAVCAAAAVTCWLLGIALWMLLPAVIVRRKLRRYLQTRHPT
jgi:hypothetical protein